jgi:hypothetical protein
MTYDPQRSHRRPRLADEAPAPVDALLEADDDATDVPGAQGPTPASGAGRPSPDGVPLSPGAGASGEVAEVGPGDVAPRPLPEVVAPEAGTGSRRAAAAVALVLLFVVLILWRRRRRRLQE